MDDKTVNVPQDGWQGTDNDAALGDRTVDLLAWRDAHPDPQITALIRDAGDTPPYHAVPWEALHSIIMHDAAPTLARWRRKASWFADVARWSPAAIPVGIAASIAATMLIMFSPNVSTTSISGGVAERTLTSTALLGTVTGSVSAQTLADGITASLPSDTLESGLVP